MHPMFSHRHHSHNQKISMRFIETLISLGTQPSEVKEFETNTNEPQDNYLNTVIILPTRQNTANCFAPLASS